PTHGTAYSPPFPAVQGHGAARVAARDLVFTYGGQVMRMVAVIAVAVLAVPARSQEMPRPGPEHQLLKKREGSWTTTMKACGQEYKGAVTNRMELGGLWLVSSLESDLGGQKFYGRSLETYDAKKKKYVSVWFDSMSATPLSMEGAYGGDKKALTMVGDGVGMD